jgi:hypothetical protein
VLSVFEVLQLPSFPGGWPDGRLSRWAYRSIDVNVYQKSTDDVTTTR